MIPPIQALLQSNWAPTEAEVILIRNSRIRWGSMPSVIVFQRNFDFTVFGRNCLVGNVSCINMPWQLQFGLYSGELYRRNLKDGTSRRSNTVKPVKLVVEPNTAQMANSICRRARRTGITDTSRNLAAYFLLEKSYSFVRIACKCKSLRGNTWSVCKKCVFINSSNMVS